MATAKLLNPSNVPAYKKATWDTYGLSSQPTINMAQYLQLVLCCCIFLSSLSISAQCHEKKNEIRGRSAASLLTKYWKKEKGREQSSKMEQSVYICHTIMRDCSNFCDAKIPLKPDKSSLKSGLIFLVGVMPPLKLSKIWKQGKETP